MFSIFPPPSFPENCTVYKMMWKNKVEPDNILRRLRIACWLAKATDTHWEYVILIVFRRHQRLRERALMLRIWYIVCLVACRLYRF